MLGGKCCTSKFLKRCRIANTGMRSFKDAFDHFGCIFQTIIIFSTCCWMSKWSYDLEDQSTLVSYKVWYYFSKFVSVIISITDTFFNGVARFLALIQYMMSQLTDFPIRTRYSISSLVLDILIIMILDWTEYRGVQYGVEKFTLEVENRPQWLD